MRVVRGKFWCESIQNGGRILLYPVTSGSQENEDFYDATPGGMIDLQVTKPAVIAMFDVGKSYYVDFIKADD